MWSVLCTDVQRRPSAEMTSVSSIPNTIGYASVSCASPCRRVIRCPVGWYEAVICMTLPAIW